MQCGAVTVVPIPVGSLSPCSWISLGHFAFRQLEVERDDSRVVAAQLHRVELAGDVHGLMVGRLGEAVAIDEALRRGVE